MGAGAFRNLHGCFLLSLLCIGTSVSVGLSTDARCADELMEEVVVTATRVPQASREVTAAQTTLTRDQILASPFRGGDQVDDLLRYVPGVQPTNLSSRYNHP